MEPWRVKLAEGDPGAAWDLFIGRYHRLISATIRRMLHDDEDVLDAFADVCQALSANELDRLRRFREDPVYPARFSTWLVTVVHNQVIDWVRLRDGRRRPTPPPSLSAIQQRIYTHVFIERRSHVETYELVRAAMPDTISFGSFLKEVAATYRAAQRDKSRGTTAFGVAPAPREPLDTGIEDRVAAAEVRKPLLAALDSLDPDDRRAVLLYVVAGLPAANVANLLGWPNAKAVYNRVYRALATLRAVVERLGIRPSDL